MWVSILESVSCRLSGVTSADDAWTRSGGLWSAATAAGVRRPPRHALHNGPHVGVVHVGRLDHQRLFHVWEGLAHRSLHSLWQKFAAI